MQTFCTIITSSHLPLAKVLYTSLSKYFPGTTLQVLIIDEHNFTSDKNLFIHSTESLNSSRHFAGIQNKYGHFNTDCFRWALKPVFICYLLEKGYEKVIFVDPDLYFVGNFDFLFKELDKSNILLTPHWANIDPLKNEDSLRAVFKGGLFNAGFIGANKKGADAIEWWGNMCLYKMERSQDLGIYDDQKYLDILPVQFENVKIIKHQGCNLASWNIDTCKRESNDGKLMINKLYEPIFIHFAKDTIINILNKNDKLLKPYLDEYIRNLKEENFDLLGNLDILDFIKYNSMIYMIKHKLRLRTRIKRFLFRLSEKL